MSLSKRIIADIMAPRFRNGDFAGGIDAGVDAIMKAIEGEQLPLPEAKPVGAQGRTRSRRTRISSSSRFFIVPVVGMVLRGLLGASSARATHLGHHRRLPRGSSSAASRSRWSRAIFAFVFTRLQRQRPRAGHAPRRLGRTAVSPAAGRGAAAGGGGFSGGGGGFDGGGASGSW